MTESNTPMTLDTAIQWMEHGAATDGNDPWAQLARAVLPILKQHPRRGDAVETWLKKYRDTHDNLGADSVWAIVDDLLDEYRLMADQGKGLLDD